LGGGVLEVVEPLGSAEVAGVLEKSEVGGLAVILGASVGAVVVG
jgi:hypothetical protein